MGSIPDPGQPHLPQSSSAPAPQILRLTRSPRAKRLTPARPRAQLRRKNHCRRRPAPRNERAARVPVKTPRGQKYISKILKNKNLFSTSLPFSNKSNHERRKNAQIMSFSSPYSLSPATSRDQLRSPRCNWVEWGAHAPLLLYFQFLINDITAEPSPNLGVIFIIRNGKWQS